jgi:hypothetical protein
MKLKDWYEERRKQIEATGWRRHGGKVGDKVKLYAEWDWREDDFYETIDGKERYCELLIENGAIGEVIELLENDKVKAEFECVISYWRKHKKTKEHKRFEFTSPHVLELEIVPLSEVDEESTLLDPVLTLVKPKPQPQQKQLRLIE